MYVSITPDENLLEAAVLNMCSVDKNSNDKKHTLWGAWELWTFQVENGTARLVQDLLILT